jgi:hypothetical protein
MLMHYSAEEFCLQGYNVSEEYVAVIFRFEEQAEQESSRALLANSFDAGS